MDESESSSAKSTSASASSSTQRVIPLSLPTDEHVLSEPLCILRQQMELFAVTEVEASERTNRRPPIGSVGFRCRRCVHMPYKSRAKGSASYPQNIGLLHQTVRNFHRFHFYACEFIPEDAKIAMKALGKKKKHSKKNSDVYWTQSSIEQLGLEDVKDLHQYGNDYIRFAADREKGTRVEEQSDKIRKAGPLHREEGLDAPPARKVRLVSATHDGDREGGDKGESQIDNEGPAKSDVEDARLLLYVCNRISKQSTSPASAKPG